MKTRNRRSYGATFKTRVVLEALKETKTLAELASSCDLHPNHISTWKKEFLENATKAFEGDKSTKQQIAKLEKEQEVPLRKHLLLSVIRSAFDDIVFLQDYVNSFFFLKHIYVPTRTHYIHKELC